MKSFGLWYLLGENETDLPETELHVNFWSIEDCQSADGEKLPCLDIGIKIRNYRRINQLTFFCPFRIEEKDIADLSDKISVKSNASIIFNMDCETHTKDHYTMIELLGKEKLLVFPFAQTIEDTYSLDMDQYGTKLKFKFQNLWTYADSKWNTGEFDAVYIRFRLKGAELKRNICFDSEPLNKSFESAFSGTRIIDFKINVKRDIDEKVRTKVVISGEKWGDLKRVHFLVMEPSAYDVNAFDDQKMSCRELEENLWDDYLGMHINLSKGHILAYHWRQTNVDAGYNCLVKVNYSKTQVRTICAYAMIVIALGIIGSAAVTAVSIWKPGSLIAMALCAGVGFLLIGAGILFGKDTV